MPDPTHQIAWHTNRRIAVTIPAQPMDQAKATLNTIFATDESVSQDTWEVSACRTASDGSLVFEALRLPKANLTGAELVKQLSLSAQTQIKELAKTPADCVAWHNRLQIMRTALRIGCEIMEVKGGSAGEAGSKATLAYVITPLELTMSLLESLHPDAIGKEHPTKPKGPSLSDMLRDGLNGGAERFRRLDLS